jgi:hypothetical protein
MENIINKKYSRYGLASLISIIIADLLFIIYLKTFHASDFFASLFINLVPASIILGIIVLVKKEKKTPAIFGIILSILTIFCLLVFLVLLPFIMISQWPG